MFYLRQYAITCIYLIIITGPIQAQDFLLLKGGVVEQKSGNAIPYVTVRIKGFAVGTITNLQGKFTFWFSDKYANESLVFSSVGYYPVEMKISDLKSKTINTIAMRIDAKDLGLVTVVDEKRMSALDILKRAISLIPKNYPQETFLFDAYYREQIIENGAVIKYADAAVTFEQGKYDGKRFDIGPMGNFGTWKSAKREGPWLGGYVGIGSVGERLHDHFRHRTSELDKVKIHEYRASLNHSKENFFANIEAGPLGTLSKDLVRYVSHFMDKRNFGKYIYELTEIPDGQGGWDYVVKFKPRRAPKDPGDVYKIGGLGNRIEILTGEVYIDQDSFVIKKINYHVGEKYRGHICSLGLEQIVHYGYNVEVDYKEQNEVWQMNRVSRTDEFLLSKSVKQNDSTIMQTTPYAAVSEIIVTQPKSEVQSISKTENLANKDFNMFYNYQSAYNPNYWKKYESQVPIARLSTSILNDLEARIPVIQQFSQRQLRNNNLNPPAENSRLRQAFITRNEVNDEGLQEDINKEVDEHSRKENIYMDDYLKPLAQMQRDLVLEFLSAQRLYQNTKSFDNITYKSWSRVKKSVKGKYYQNRKLKAVGRDGKSISISLFFMGKDKDKFIDDRPLVIQVKGKQNKGGGLGFDPLLVPLLNRGVVFAFVHLNEVDLSSLRAYIDMKPKEQDESVNQFIDAVKFIKENELGSSDMTFTIGEGTSSMIISSALNKESDLLNGALLNLPQVDIVHGVFNSSDPYIASRLARWGTRRKQQLREDLKKISPYENVKAHHYPNTVFFTSKSDPSYWQSMKMVTRLRELKKDKNKVLIRMWPAVGNDPKSIERNRLEFLSQQYILMFQWIDDIKSAETGVSLKSEN